jgi:dTDP-4-amino-4,6-dideoxygalactose transaminase
MGAEDLAMQAAQEDLVMQATAKPTKVVHGCPKFKNAAKFDQPSIVPASANERVLELMASGRIFRYTLPKEESDASKAEQMVADWIGHKYCVGVNSCSSGINLAMKVCGVKHGDKVITNAFTFTALPSTIHNVGAVPVFVESTDGFQMDVADLEHQIRSNPDAKVLLLSHFRGKVSDCDAIAAIAEEHGLTLIEDCAHAMGIKYRGKPAGRKGVIAIYSVQSDKVVNAGEGGFITTDNPEWAAQLVFLSGAYEKRYTQHIAAPVEDIELMEHAMTHNHNCSYRMSNIVGAMVCAQMPILQDRVDKWNANGEVLLEALQPAIDTGDLIVPPEIDGAEGCFDHCVFTTPNFDQKQRDFLGKRCKDLGVALKPFGTYYNARFFKNWNFLPDGSRGAMERTENLILHSWDMKTPNCFDPDDMREIGAIMVQCIAEAAAL